jgi:hypothetical protein
LLGQDAQTLDLLSRAQQQDHRDQRGRGGNRGGELDHLRSCHARVAIIG